MASAVPMAASSSSMDSLAAGAALRGLHLSAKPEDYFSSGPVAISGRSAKPMLGKDHRVIENKRAIYVRLSLNKLFFWLQEAGWLVEPLT